MDEEGYKDDGLVTTTSMDQHACEQLCGINLLPYDTAELTETEFAEFLDKGIISDAGEGLLMRDLHVDYLKNGLGTLPGRYVGLDASRTWMIYWIVHSLDLMDRLPEELLPNIISTLTACRSATGGFGGGPSQDPHCAPAFSAALALMIAGTPEAYAAIDRRHLYQFYMRMKSPSGGFAMHEDGEVDVRGTYTVMAIASLLNMLTPELVAGVAEYSLSCQTYEGGFGGEPWNEAHGGYAFCAFASLVILGREATDRVHLDNLEWWLCNRQMAMEGGFQGRTNKLVDGCYSFWQGGTAALVEYVRRGLGDEVALRDGMGGGSGGGMSSSNSSSSSSSSSSTSSSSRASKGQAGQASGMNADDKDGTVDADGVTDMSHMVASIHEGSGELSYNQEALQKYTLFCAQQWDGGLRDKPGKPRDFYHTCYNLSGLSVSQHCLSGTPSVLGDAGNELRPTNPVYNITEDRARRAKAHFARMPCSHSLFMEPDP